jgi:WD40 repeat protein/tRNA A-37 threonylcarbamoyl transferase component Bud32
MADTADRKTPDESVASDDTVLATPDDTVLATPGSSGGGRPIPADLSALAVDHSDRYALGDVHAAGGLGRVVRARDRRLHRTVAVKELLQRTPAAEARFIREALITAQLEHPGVVPVHDAARWPSGEPFYSMKLVSGRTLRDLILSRKKLDERLALVPNAIAVAEAIAYAHSREVIHRDIKPPNVLVGDFGETVVIDWGLAKDLSGRVAEPEVEALSDPPAGSGSGELATAAGNVMGTPAYMAPEQARGEEVDARADVYSLGSLLYEILTGAPPHVGPSLAEVLASAQKGSVVSVEQREPDAPPDLCAIVRKAMAPERADRYPTAMEMAADLRRFQTGQLVTARQYSTPALVLRWIARHRAIVAVVAAAAVALAVVGVVAFRRVMEQRNRAETAMHGAERARDELVFRQAQSLLERDPTAALAWLKTYPLGGERAALLGPMIDDAVAAGVARHVLLHHAWVMRLAFTADGRLVTADQGGDLVSWDLATGRGRDVLHHHGGEDVELSPDGATLLVSDEDGTIEIQPTDGGRPRRARGLTEPTQPRFSADGRRVIARDDTHLRVWDAASGEVMLAVDDEPGKFANLSPDGSLLYVARASGEIVERRVGSDPTPRTVVRLDDPALVLVVSPDGRQILFGDTEDGVGLVDIQSGRARMLGRHTISGDGWLEFSHGLDRVALTAGDNSIVLYDLATGAEQVLRGHTDPPYRAHFSRDDSRLFSSSDDGTVRIWNLVTGEAQVLRGHTDDVLRIAISPDEKWLASASFDGTVRIWPLGGGVARALPGGVVDPQGIAWVRGGTRVVVGNRDRETESFDVATGRSNQFRLEEWQDAGPPALGDRLVIAADARGGATLYDAGTGVVRRLPHEGGDPVSAVAISEDDRRAVTVERAGEVVLWNLASGESRRIAIGRPAKQVAFLPGRREVLLAGKGFLELWDLDQGRAVARAADVSPEFQPAERIVFSRDGRVVADNDHDDVLLWDTTSGRVDFVDGDSIVAVAVAPDGSRIAMAMGDRTVHTWEIAGGHRQVLAGHTDLAMQVAFSPDGTLLASCAFDHTIRLWTRDGRSRVLRGHGSAVTAIAFSPDGKTLASVGADGTVRLWPLAALPDIRPAGVPARLAGATSAVVDSEGRVLTP